MQQSIDRYYEKFSRFVYEEYGIHYGILKKDMLMSKVDKLMQRNGISSYGEYYTILLEGSNSSLMKEFVNEITVNKTDFFREVHHFDFIKNHIDTILSDNSEIKLNRKIRIWSSACSTGQEAYTLAMVFNECLKDKDIEIKVLATDVSTRVLSAAQRGVYPLSIQSEIQPYYLEKYFKKHQNEYQIAQSIRDQVVFRQFNLMDNFPFAHLFDIVFCRNVMIYFDPQTQQKLLNKFYHGIVPGGLLFIGHSESLINKIHNFQYIQPTIYRK